MKGGLTTYPIVDLFAGPGGLGEGFASVGETEGTPRFRSVASVEDNQFAYRTLLLRHFFRAFPPGEAPAAYYDYLGGEIDAEELFSAHPKQLSAAHESALEISKENGCSWAVRHAKLIRWPGDPAGKATRNLVRTKCTSSTRNI